MNKFPTNSESKFQVERLILFSDAVFAIAITLLILEIKAPILEGVPRTDKNFLIAFNKTIPQFIGFLMSFAMIGLFWSKHHDLFGYVKRYDYKLIFLNLLFLCSVVFMPYTTEIYSEYTRPEDMQMFLPFEMYSLNIVFCGVTLFLLWNYIGNPDNQLVGEDLTKRNVYRSKANTLILPAVFLLSLIVTYLTDGGVLGRFTLFALPFVYIIVNRQLDKKD